MKLTEDQAHRLEEAFDEIAFSGDCSFTAGSEPTDLDEKKVQLQNAVAVIEEIQKENEKLETDETTD